jgi:predicted dehydrogenase
MNLTEEQKTIGRRNFLKVAAGAPALVALGAAALTRGPITGGPVKFALIGTGDMGNGHLSQYQKEFLDLKAVCDINPKRRAAAVAKMVKAGWPKPNEYDNWQDMLQKEDLEAVQIATPLWTHSEIAVGCLNAGKHVLCEKMMAKSEAECLAMIDASRKSKKILEIGYQRYYNPIYQATYDNIIKAGLLGDVYHARLAWHRNSSWRKKEEAPSPNFDPGKWGYPDWDHLLNWRMYNKYSEGLLCELGSHQITAASWFFDSAPEAVYMSGGTYRYKDGREVYDHVFATFNYPGDRTATFSSIQSNAFEDAYEMYMGTKGTLILTHEVDAYLFNEGEGPTTTKVEVSKQGAGPVADSSASRPIDSPGRTVEAQGGAGQGGAAQGPPGADRNVSYKNEVAEFCAAVRTGSPIRCGPEKAMKSAMAIITGNRSAREQAKLQIPKPA